MRRIITQVEFVPEHFSSVCNATIPEAWEAHASRQTVAMGDTREEVINLALQRGFTLARNVKRSIQRV